MSKMLHSSTEWLLINIIVVLLLNTFTREILSTSKPTFSSDSLCKSSKLLDFFFCGTLISVVLCVTGDSRAGDNSPDEAYAK